MYRLFVPMVMGMSVMVMPGMLVFIPRLLMAMTMFPVMMNMTSMMMMPLPGTGTSFQYRLFLIYTHQLN